jgi:hypothetical protein
LYSTIGMHIIFKRILLLSALLVGSALFGGLSAQAQTFYSLNLDACTGTCGTAPFGTVEVQAESSTTVKVTLTLTKPGELIIDTGAHYAFTFNLTGVSGTPNITNLSPTAVLAVATPPGPFTQPGFGAFSNALICTICGSGASNKSGMDPTTFSFLVTDLSGLTPANFTSNGSAVFTADILGNNGKTGAVGTNVGVLTTPEPASMALFGTGLLAIGAFVRRRLKAGVPNIS